MKKNITSIAVGLLALSLLAGSPLAAFAKDDNGKAQGPKQERIAARSDSDNDRDDDKRPKLQNPKPISTTTANGWRGWFGWLNGRGHGLFNNGDDDRNNDGRHDIGTTSNSQNATAPVITGITAPTVLAVGETGTWSVKAYDPQNGSLSYAVDWGDSSTKALNMLGAFVQTSSFTHAYAQPGTYKATFTVTDDTGQKAVSSVTVHIGATTAAPVISKLVATSTRPRQARITWTTDIRSSSLVWLSTSSPVVTTGSPAVTRNGKTLNHRIDMTRLVPGTTYYVVVGSAGPGGARTLSSETSFVTPALPITDAPIISSITGSSTIQVGDQGTWTVSASDPHNSALSYSVDWGDSNSFAKLLSVFGGQTAFVQTATFTHIYVNPGTYTITFTVQNAAGKKTSSTETVNVTAKTDATAPVLSAIASVPGASTSTISWTTDEPSTSKLLYSTVSPIDPNATTTVIGTDASLVTSHTFALSTLATSTQYYFIVSSTDASGNAATSSQQSFITTSGQ